jgi:aminoglycoside phosphotransferase (APT) family kinase protein
MESITKPLVTRDQLSLICQEHLGEGLESARELTDGWFNAAFLLVGVGGREAVLKMAPPDSVRVMRYEQGLMNAEVSALRLVKERTSIPVPAVIAYDTSRQLVGSDFFLTDRLPGRPLSDVRSEMGEEVQAHVDRQVGGHLRELHEVHGPRFGTFNSPDSPSWGEAFGLLMDWLRQDAADLEVELPDGTFEAAEPHLWALAEAETPTLVHWDLWDPNIFVLPDSGDVTGYIDFERALWGDPLIEANFREPRAAFMEAYGSCVMDAPGSPSRRLLYTLYLDIIMVIESRFRGFTAEHETWARGLLEGAIRQCAA